jgi:hypothetical protein
MKEDKPKSIRTLGIALAIISTLGVLGNIGSLFMLDHVNEVVSNAEIPYYPQALSYARPVAILTIVLASVMLVAGVYIVHYKNWARVLIQVVAVVYLLFFWYQSIFILPYNPFDKGEFGMEQLIGALIISVLIVLLIRYLNKEKIKNHFA